MTVDRTSTSDSGFQRTHSRRRAKAAHKEKRRLLLEGLEPRLFLDGTGPQLFAIRPDQRALLEAGDVLDVAPRELNLYFQGGANIDGSTIARSVRLVRSGQDGIFGNGNDVLVDLGFVGFSDPSNTNLVVMRPASSSIENSFRPESAMPDDLYRIQIQGTGANALKNLAGESFNGGVNFAQDFELNLGAQVVSVVPQPVSRNSQRITINGATGGTFTLSFQGETTAPISVTAPNVATVIETRLVSLLSIDPQDVQVTGTGPWDVHFQGRFAGEQVGPLTANGSSLSGPGTPSIQVTRLASLTQSRDQIVVYTNRDELNTTDALSPTFYRLVHTGATLNPADDSVLLPAQVQYDQVAQKLVLTFAQDIPDGTYELQVGVSDEPNGIPGQAISVGTLFSRAGNDFAYVTYLGDTNGSSSDTGDQDLYRVHLATPGNATISVIPSAGLDPVVTILGPDGVTPVGAPQNIGTEGITETLLIALPAGDFFVRVTSDTTNPANTAGSYRITMDVSTGLNIVDNNSSLIAATDLGILGAAGQQFTSQIETQSVPMPQYPGSVDEPGHRDIQGEQHISGNDVFQESVVPNGIAQIRYYFGSIYGTDSVGNNLTNQITDGQKQLARQIFEIYSSQLGVQFIEVSNGNTSDLQVVTGSVAAVTNAQVNGTFGVTKRLNHLVALMDSTQYANDDKYGGAWFNEAVRQIGQAIGGDSTPWLIHSYDVISAEGAGVSVPLGPRFPGDPAYTGPVGEPVYPGDNDLVHFKREARPDSTDIDLYRFQIPEAGTFTAEISAQRMNSLLDSVLTLFDEQGRVLSQNDNYFSKDSYLELELAAGTYYIGVTSTGNSEYSPNVANSGFGGTSQGQYELSMQFTEASINQLRDSSGVPFDGDADGVPGGAFHFWFQSSDDTLFVDKANDQRANTVDGNGSLSGPAGDPAQGPYDSLQFALDQAANRIVAPRPSGILDGERFTVRVNDTDVVFEFNLTGGLPANGVDISAAVTADDVATAIHTALSNAAALSSVAIARQGNVVTLDGIQSLDLRQSHGLLTAPNLVRIVGNGGIDSDVNTLGDNRPYLLGLDNANSATSDGAEFLVPQGTTVMVDGGALFKMRRANLAAGTSSTGVDRSAGAIQVLGVPGRPVYLRSLRDDTVGGDSDGVGPAPTGGDFGGIVFRADSDLEQEGIFLNWVNHADIDRGGGKVPVESREEVFTPVHMVVSRPTVTHNRITRSAGAAMSADPNSFSDEGGRIGPEIHSNSLFAIQAGTGAVLDNTVNGLFVRIETQAGNPVDKLTTTARFDDDDIAHVITENLHIVGNPGGTLDGNARLSGRLQIDPGVVVKLANARIEAERGASSLIAEGSINGPVIFTSIKDDRFGGSGLFDTDRGTSTPKQGDWGGLVFNAVSSASIDHALITFAGGQTPIEGSFSVFNTIEAHQARLRLSNSILENNASGRASDDRNGRGNNTDAVIFVRGGQPVIVNNVIRNNNLDRLGNAAPTNVISINANALQSEVQVDYGRSTGPSERFAEFGDNHGPLVRLNRLDNNGTNGMEVRGAYLTTESIWDDTDIVHVVRQEIMVGNHHTYSGLRLQSSNTESLVVKFSGTNAGFTATGTELDIDDRIGGTVQVLGTIGHPVILTSLADDTAGAGFTPSGNFQTNTDNGNATPAPGNWRSIRLDKLSNDRNVGVVNELERPFTDANDVNATTSLAEHLGQLAPDAKSGDENRRLGFEVHGIISVDDPADEDIYSFQATGGTRVWLDLDRTAPGLDARVELLNISGSVLASASSNTVRSGLAETMSQNFLLGGDYYSLNPNDGGMSLVLPGTGTGTYFVRVRADGPRVVDSSTVSLQFHDNGTAPHTVSIAGGSFVTQGFAAGQLLVIRGSNNNDGEYLIDSVTANTITLKPGAKLVAESAPTGTRLNANLTSGEYQLQVRLQQRDEKPGSAVRYADIRYASTGIEVRGLPYHSNVLGEIAEVEGGDAGNVSGSAFLVGNVLASDRGTLTIGGEISNETDVDWYEFTLDHSFVENAVENSSGLKTVALVFDVDFADGLARPDTTIAIYDSQNRLIYIGRDSDIADDQPSGTGDPSADLSRGSSGKLDPYIGPIHLPVGFTNGASLTYRMAVMSNRMAPNAIMGLYLAGGGQANVRLEPANGVQRIVEDHIGSGGFGQAPTSGYISGTFTPDVISMIENRFETSPQSRTVTPTTSRIFNTSNTTTLTTQVLPFTLADVRLYISTEEDLYSVDPLHGDDRVRVGDTFDEVEDIVFRTDGRFYAYQRVDVDQTDTDGPFGNEVADTAGQLLEVNTGNGTTLSTTNDGVRGPTLATNNPVVPGNYRHDITYTDQVDAVTFLRTPPTASLAQAPQYDVYYSVRDPNVASGDASKLYRDNSPTDVADGVVPAIDADDENTDNNGGLIGYIGATKGFASTSINNGTDTVTIGFFPNDVGPNSNGYEVRIVQDASNATPTVSVSVVGKIITATIRHNNGGTAATAQQVVDAVNAALDGGAGFAAVMDGEGGLNIANTTTVTIGNRTIGPTAGGARTLRGVTTGLAFVDNDGDGDGDQLYGVTNQGEFFRITTTTPSDSFLPTANVTVLADLGAGVNFQGLSVGPQNLRDLNGANPGFYRRMVFAIEQNGTLRAFDTSKAAPTPEPVFPNGATTQTMSVGSGVTGLAFSPFDFNLWHPTMRRGSDDGHGLNPSVDNERNPGQRVATFGPNSTSDAQGNQSFYFGLEQFDADIVTGDFVYQTYGGSGQGASAQLGVTSNILHNDLTSNAAIGNNYNLPGGALGSLVSGTFSLAGYSSNDEPTLYFNYWLQTEDAAGGPHFYNPGDVFPKDRSMRDSARVFISNDGVNWDLVATNNSTLSIESKNCDDLAELSTFISHSATANFTGGSSGAQCSNGTYAAEGRLIEEQQVQELFDVSDWRQVRIDLHQYAGMSNLRLRFDFSTAGSMDQGMPGDEFGAFDDAATTNDTTARARGLNNAFEGFYVDDIIVGFAERGEMVTGAAADSTIFDLETSPRTDFPDPTAPVRHLTGDYQVEIRRAGEYAQILTGLRDDLIMKSGFPYDTNDRFVLEPGTRELPGDRNVDREQGQIIIDSNLVTNSLTFGIDVSAGSRSGATNRPRPGSLIRFDKQNTDELYPGAVIQNNVIAFSGQGGIRFAGDAATPDNAPMPFGRIVNNSIYGGNTRNGVGIRVENNASPTILNNIIANTTNAIQIGAGSNPVVIGSNLFHNNATPTQATDALAGSNPLFQLASDPLFVSTTPLQENFYLQAGSLAIDSSLNSLQDRLSFANFKAELGIPQSPIFATDRDVYGQLRVDDPNEDPLGGGAAIFKDRGAVDRADEDQPYATLILPVDNDSEGFDLDPNDTIVQTKNIFLSQFSILLGDGPSANAPFQGTGVNPLTVDDSTNPAVSQRAVRITQDGRLLTEGVDYILGYSPNNNVLSLTPLSALWEPNSVYVITLDNNQIRDRAGNRLRRNQNNGDTTFRILLGEFDFDFGDAPDFSYGTLAQNNGARHVLLPNAPLYLGSRVDAETDGQPVVSADGRNHAIGDDLDQSVGLGTSPLTLVGVAPYTVQLPLNGGAGISNGQFFTLDRDGAGPDPAVRFQFDLNGDDGLASPTVAIKYYALDPADLMGQRIASAINGAGITGVTAQHLGGGVLNIAGPSGLVLNTSSAASMAPTNLLPVGLRVPSSGTLIADGHVFEIRDGHNASLTFEFDDLSGTVGVSNPDHVPVPFNGATYDASAIALALANAIDTETNSGRLTGIVALAQGDTVVVRNADNTMGDDEDGVTFGKLFVPGASTGPRTISVVSSGTGKLDAWIDFNQNGLFEPAEKLPLNGSTASTSVVAGVNTLTFDMAAITGVPVVSGYSYARFRLSTTGVSDPTGDGIGGEVEDYEVRLLANTAPGVINSFVTLVNSGELLNGANTIDADGDGAPDSKDTDGDGRLDLSVGVDVQFDITNAAGKAVFNDVDIANGNGDFLSYSIVSNSNASLLSAQLNGSVVALDLQAGQTGTAVIIIEAVDHGGLTVRDTLTVEVTAFQNSAPTLVAGGPDLLNAATSEDSASPAVPVTTLLTNASFADANLNPKRGIAVTAVSGKGQWQYSADGASGWTNFGTTSATSSRLLPDTYFVRYQPDGKNGEPGLQGVGNPTITYRGWDQTSGTSGGTADTSTNGGSTPFSAETRSANLVVTDVNDAPTLVQTSVTLNPVPAANEDMTALNAPVFVVSSFRTASDVDLPTNSLGIAVTGLTKRMGGSWEFSVNGGTSFSAIPANIGESQALLLRPADVLRYLPDQQNGEVATITYLAWDQTSHSAGTQVDLTGASATGGTSAFSDRAGAKQTASLTVSSVNDAPVAVDDNGGTDEDTVVTIAVLANDVEVDLNQTLDPSYIVGFDATSSAGAAITRNADGTFRYDPTAAPNLQRLAPTGPLSQTQLLDSFTYTISDGQSTPVSATVRVLVTGKDDAPLPQNDPGATNQSLFRTTQNALLTIPSSALLDNDVDDFGDTLRVVSIAPLAGTLGSVSAVSSGGTVTQVDYSPGTAFRHLPLGVAAMDQFLYTVSDQNGVTRSATVTVTVDGLNDAPDALNDQFSAPANLLMNTQRPGVLGTGASRDTDPDDGETNTLSVIPQDLTSNRGAPVTVRSDGSFSYDPRGVQAFRALRPGQTLQDTFVYRVKDLPLNGANQFLEDTATVTVTVTGVNDAPQAVADTAFGPAHENQLLSISAPGVLANDSDVDGDAIQARAFAGTSNLGAAVTLASNGSFQYDPRGVAAFQQMRTGQSLTDFFTYSIEDVPGQLSASQSVATVTIVVNGQNDAPLAVNDSYINSPINEDAVLTVPAASGLAVNDSDEEGDAFSVVVVPTLSAAGATITLNADGSFAYDPRSSNTLQRLAAGANTTDTFTYLLRDSAGNVSTAGTVSVHVTGANDAPVPVNDDLATSGGMLQTDEDSALVIQESTLVANDTDDFGNTFSLISVDTLNTKGSVSLQLDLAGSRITYFPNSQFDSLKLGEQATDVFTYTIRDQDRLTGTATVTVTITGTNDTPIANPDSYTIDEDSVLNVAGVGVLFNDTDAEGDVITTLAITTSSTLGASVTINADGTFTYDPTAVEAAQALDAGGSLQDTFTYTVTDGTTQATGVVMMTITGRNDAPRPGSDTYAVSEEGTLNVGLAQGLLSNDVDPEGHAMQAALESAPLHGSVTVNSDGTLTYSPTKDFFGTDTFRYRVSDATSSSVGTVTIQVTGTNDSPVASGDSYTVNQDSSLVVSVSNGLLVNDSDVDQEPLRARRLSGPSRGTVSVNNDGSFTYTPQPGFFGTDTFQYQAFDAAGAASTATVTINVLNTRPWRNPQNALDVSGDGFVTPQDVLLIVNYLNANGPGPVPTPAPTPPPYRDTNGDNFITPNDALLVINFLNQSVGEGESSSADEMAEPLDSNTVLANAASALGQPAARFATPAIERSAVEFVDEVFGDSEPGVSLTSSAAGVAGVRSTSDDEDAEDELSSLIEEIAAQSADDDRDSIFGWLGR